MAEFINNLGLQRGKRARLRGKEWDETEGVGVGERKRKKGWPYRRLLPPADTQALRDFSLGFQRREDWNSALPEPEFEFSAKRR